MDTRKSLLMDLDFIYKTYQELRALVENSPDQELEDILGGHFNINTMNVCNHFEFMKFLITKKYCDGSDVTNEEIEKYFDDNWECHVAP